MTEKKTEPDILGKDGCLRCGMCGKRKQIKVNFMGRERTVNCLCDCEIKERQEREEQIRREEAQRDLYRRKSVGLKDRRFWEWRFENDDGSNDKMLIARQYVEHWGEMKVKMLASFLWGRWEQERVFLPGVLQMLCWNRESV